MKFQIRTYRPDDLPGLTLLMNQWDKDWHFTEEEIRQSADSVLKNNSEILVADGPGGILGYIFTVPCYQLGFQPFVEVVSFLVDGNHRSLGIGEKLISAAEERAKASGFSVVKLSSQTYRKDAHRFYERQGYAVFKESRFFKKDIC